LPSLSEVTEVRVEWHDYIDGLIFIQNYGDCRFETKGKGFVRRDMAVE